MDPPVQALLWDFTSLWASNSTLKSVLDAIVARHRDARVASPVQCHLAYPRLTRCLAALARVLGRMGTSKESPATWL
jgi:hypothetical protein